MFHIFFTILCVLAAWKWGDRRNWKLYYPTILFVIAGHFIYESLSISKHLWLFESHLLGHTIPNFLIAFIVYPALTIIYLPHFPMVIFRDKLLYVSAWVLIISLSEYVSYSMGFFSYHNGWNIWWSVLFNCVWLPMVRIHHTKPIYGIIMAMTIGAIITSFFHIPILG